jgi:transcriptional regulator with XRE-family HTH domain
MAVDQPTFAARLRLARENASMTGAELARRLSVKRSAISNLESGTRSPSVDTLFAMAKELEVTTDFLLGLERPHPDMRPALPTWLSDLLPDLESLDRSGQAAVKALVKGLKK